MIKTFKKTTRALAAATVSAALLAGPVLAAGSPGVEKTTQAFLDALAASGGQPLETLSPADARQILVGAQAGANVKLPAADVSAKTVRLNGEDVTVHIVKPVNARGKLPVFMFFHGGGWILGDFPTHERLVRDLVVASGAAAVFVDYTPSPEAHYPVAINQAYAATKWVSENGDKIGVDGKRLALAGNSVGGNMAAVVALKAKIEQGPAIRAQLLLWPVTDASFENASYNQFGNGHFLTKGMMQWFWDAYTVNPAERNEILASPLRASVNELAGLPPALVQTAEMDVLRDEGEAYARKLNEAGVPVIATRYNGMIHDYGLLNVLADVPAVKAAMRQGGDFLKESLK
ncbi:alpha/beta hydrolase [Gimibacter soli]|uniref:Alpha/beta hydrolase n=1 Tax=Gimibacter soli TaxID=3024400 RepID=A0AAF0BMF8_9PROT|nr:alpha/beta hydrolase [Gimibacter soli]WCL54510.1 alpha/beta hydrolase [Gimibacter soli]